jgi:hypothetical protein
MQELDCDLLMVCANVSPDSLGGIDRAAADLHELGERAVKRGLRVGFEALAWSRHKIVERRGYRGFGAPNAPIRLAAQTRLARHPTVPRN